MTKRVWAFSAALLLVTVAGVSARSDRDDGHDRQDRRESHERHERPLVVTMSNADSNEILVFDTHGHLLETVATEGQGGVAGNAGGIVAADDTLAVVNFGSSNVSLFRRGHRGLVLRQLLQTASPPVSVAFGRDHLYILGTTTVESHRRFHDGVNPTPDGVVALFLADGSAAQVGVLEHQLIISEKNNVVELVDLHHGAVNGTATSVPLPAGAETPFGLTTRGPDAYVTLAHSDQAVVVRDGAVGKVVATGTPGGAGQHAPCWVALVGPYLYSANSPSHSLTRFLAVAKHLFEDEPVAATTSGAPIDVASAGPRLAVLDTAATESHVTIFAVDYDGDLTPIGAATVATPAANGMAILQ